MGSPKFQILNIVLLRVKEVLQITLLDFINLSMNLTNEQDYRFRNHFKDRISNNSINEW